MESVTTRLRAAGSVFAEDEAAILGESARDAAELDAWVARRAAGEPLEQVVGHVDFAGLRLAVTPGSFVPRRRTELVARAAVELLPRDGVLLDLCCGVGAIAAVVAARRDDVEVHASDVDPTATEVARRNLPGATVHTGDLFDALSADLRSRLDVVAVNAPYVPTDEIVMMPPEARDHEPHATLDGGPDGVDWHRRIAAEAGPWLSAAGVVVVETGRRQVPLTTAAFETHGFSTTIVTDDEIGGTAVIARRAEVAGSA